jgi:hypothetical protein
VQLLKPVEQAEDENPHGRNAKKDHRRATL